MALKAKQVIYKVKDTKGKSVVEKGKVDFMESKYKEPQKLKKYDFAKFTNGISEGVGTTARKVLNKNRGKFATATASNNNYDVEREIDPIKTDTSDSSFLFNNEDAIVVNLKNKKSE